MDWRWHERSEREPEEELDWMDVDDADVVMSEAELLVEWEESRGDVEMLDVSVLAPEEREVEAQARTKAGAGAEAIARAKTRARNRAIARASGSVVCKL